LELFKFLVSEGFKQSKSDYSLFSQECHGKYAHILVYIDDLLVSGDDENGITMIKQALHTTFTVKDLGLARFFLGIEISRSSTGTLLNQRKYALDILKDAGLTRLKPTRFPLPKGLKLTFEIGELMPNLEAYRGVIGRLLYLTITRPNISYVFSVNCCGRFVCLIIK